MRFFLFLVFVTPLWAQTSYVAPARLLRSKGYEIILQAESWKTSKYLDRTGKAEPLPEGASFGRIQSQLSGFYGATNDLQFGVGIRFRQNSGTFNSPIDGQSVSATGSGIQSTFASIKFAFKPVDRLQYTLEGLFRFIPYSNEEVRAPDLQPAQLSLGDEGNQLEGGLGVTYTGNNHLYATARGGYRKAGTHLSDELYYQLELAKSWQGLAILAGADGVVSVKNDPYGDTQSQRPAFWFGPTQLYHQENREFLAPFVGVNFALGKRWRVEARGSQVMAGRSTDLGMNLSLALIRREDTSDVMLVDSRFKTYDLEVGVKKISPEQNYVVIDKGLADDVFKGMRFDFFEFDYVGGNVLVASGIVYQVKSDSAIVKITQRYSGRTKLKEGLVGRANLK